MNDLSRELGGAMGIALIGSSLTVGYRSSVDDSAAAIDPGRLDAVRDSAAAGPSAADQASPLAGQIVGVIQQALVDGFSTSMVVATVLLVSAAIVIGLRTPTSAANSALDADARS